MSELASSTPNSEAFEKWLKITEGTSRKRYIVFVDGDPVEMSDDFASVAVNAFQLKALRGRGAELSIYDSETHISSFG